jgi:hypothetical protein
MSSQAENIAQSLSHGQSMEYVDGVIAGYHEFANDLGLPGGVTGRLSLEKSRHLLKFSRQIPHDWNDQQRVDWVDGYISGYNVRRDPVK